MEDGRPREREHAPPFECFAETEDPITRKCGQRRKHEQLNLSILRDTGLKTYTTTGTGIEAYYGY